MALLALSLGVGCRAFVVAGLPGPVGCNSTKTVEDPDGTVHVEGCGSERVYHCSEHGSVRTHEKLVGSPDREVSGYDASGHAVTVHVNGDQHYETVADDRRYWDCDEEEPDPLLSAPSTPKPPKVAPQVAKQTKDGHAELRLEFEVNNHAWLKLHATPSERRDGVHLWLSRGQLDRSLDACELFVFIDRKSVPAHDVTGKRDDEMFANGFWLTDPELSSLDQVKKLSFISCDRRWFLNRDQIFSVRDFMSQFRQELARLPPPAPPPSAPPEPAPASAPSGADAPRAPPPAAFPDAPSAPHQ